MKNVFLTIFVIELKFMVIIVHTGFNKNKKKTRKKCRKYSILLKLCVMGTIITDNNFYTKELLFLLHFSS